MTTWGNLRTLHRLRCNPLKMSPHAFTEYEPVASHPMNESLRCPSSTEKPEPMVTRSSTSLESPLTTLSEAPWASLDVLRRHTYSVKAIWQSTWMMTRHLCSLRRQRTSWIQSRRALGYFRGSRLSDPGLILEVRWSALHHSFKVWPVKRKRYLGWMFLKIKGKKVRESSQQLKIKIRILITQILIRLWIIRLQKQASKLRVELIQISISNYLGIQQPALEFRFNNRN